MKIFAIANAAESPGEEWFARVKRLSDAGVDFILLRDKELGDSTRVRTAERCRTLIAPPSRMLIHGRFDLALASAADGVHLSSTSLPTDAVRAAAPDLVVGRSCHSVLECAAAAREGLAYALLGPIFPPRSKSGGARISRADLTRAATLGVDVYALGGISVASLEELEGTGIAGVAAITLFMQDEPLEEIVERVRRA